MRSSKPDSGMGPRWDVHVTQKMAPHSRQYCRSATVSKGTRHLWHASIAKKGLLFNSSGIRSCEGLRPDVLTLCFRLSFCSSFTVCPPVCTADLATLRPEMVLPTGDAGDDGDDHSSLVSSSSSAAVAAAAAAAAAV